MRQLIALAVVLSFLLSGCAGTPLQKQVRSFDECVNAGYQVLESYPRQCLTPDGTMFVSEKDIFEFEKKTSCASDGECVLADSGTGFNCCPGSDCEPADYSSDRWIALNRVWYDSSARVYCPPAETCGPSPMCDPMPANTDYSAVCLAGQCRKVPNSCVSDGDCGSGLSCWYRLPAGPSAGVPGSESRPGRCYDEALVRRIVAPAGDVSARCCLECVRSFNQSTAGAGPGGVKCGYFSSSWEMSAECQLYFKSNPMSAESCGAGSTSFPPQVPAFVSGSCNALKQEGPMDGKLNIIFIPSHHYSGLSSFASSVPHFRDALLSFPFYGNSSQKINMFFLADTSASDGCALAGNTTPYCDIPSIREMAAACNYSQARGDQLVVLFDNSVVSTPFARGEIGEGVLFIGSAAYGIFPHEFSHSFGGLADTYDGAWNNTVEPDAPNCASAAPGYTCADKWGDLIGTGSGDQLVGCYQNCHAENWFRPTLGGDVMRDLGKDFYDPVSLRHMQELMSAYH